MFRIHPLLRQMLIQLSAHIGRADQFITIRYGKQKKCSLSVHVFQRSVSPRVFRNMAMRACLVTPIYSTHIIDLQLEQIEQC